MLLFIIFSINLVGEFEVFTLIVILIAIFILLLGSFACTPALFLLLTALFISYFLVFARTFSSQHHPFPFLKLPFIEVNDSFNKEFLCDYEGL